MPAIKSTTATDEFRNLEWLRTKTRHDEAQALRNAERKRDAHWQGVVAEKDAENSELRAQLEELRRQIQTNNTLN